MRYFEIEKQIIKKNRFSRCGRIRKSTEAVAIHFVANKKTNAYQTGNYFSMLAKQVVDAFGNLFKKVKYRFASTQYGIDNDRIIQYIPENEVAYNCGANKYTDFAIKKFGYYCEHPKKTSPNEVTTSIELHHPEIDGKPYEGAILRCIDLTSTLCIIHDLNPLTDVIRHFDVSGKNCPRWYVANPSEWIKLVNEINKEFLLKKELIKMKQWDPKKSYEILTA